MKTITITDEGTTIFNQIITDAQADAAIAAATAVPVPALPTPIVSFGQGGADGTRSISVTAENPTGGRIGIEAESGDGATIFTYDGIDPTTTQNFHVPAEPCRVRAVVRTVDGVSQASDWLTF